MAPCPTGAAIYLRRARSACTGFLCHDSVRSIAKGFGCRPCRRSQVHGARRPEPPKNEPACDGARRGRAPGYGDYMSGALSSPISVGAWSWQGSYAIGRPWSGFGFGCAVEQPKTPVRPSNLMATTGGIYVDHRPMVTTTNTRLTRHG